MKQHWKFISNTDHFKYNIYLCELCNSNHRVNKYNVQNGKSTKCRKCYYESKVVHGHARKKKGKKIRAGLYGIWEAIVQRCRNENHTNYHRYGGRGIKLLWRSYKDFYNDMIVGYKPGLTIERIDNDGHYEKSNCRWATRYEQSQNRHNSKLIEHYGQIKTVSQWASDLGITQQAMTWRLDKWTKEQALTKPKNQKYDRTKNK